MNIYYIDYENVTNLGLKGIELLSEADEVNLLYSKKAETMKIDTLTQLMASRAKINFLPVHVGTPNALDFQLITLLFLHYTEGNRYFIISKDSGYDCCIKTAIENDAPNVFRFPNIESAVAGRQQTKQTRTRRGSGRGRSSQVQEQDQIEEELPVSADLLPPAVQQIIEQAEETAPADPGDAAAEIPAQAEPAKKRSSRRRGRRKSASAASVDESSTTSSQAENPENMDAPADQAVSETADDKEAGNDTAAQTAETEKPSRSRRQNQNRGSSKKQTQGQQTSGQQADNEEALKNPPQGSRDDSSRQRGQNTKPDAEKNNKPVTILSVIRRRNDVQLDLHQIDLIREALKTTTNKQQFYNYFAKKLGQKKGMELYHSIKSSYSDLISANLA